MILKKTYQCAVVKFKLKKKHNEQSLWNFKSYVEMFHNKHLVEEKGWWSSNRWYFSYKWKKLANKYVVNNINKRYKEEKSTDKRKWDFL